MSSSLTDRLLTEEEGVERTVYKDSLGYWSIGIGCCVDPAVKGVGLCDAAIAAQLDHDKATAIVEAQNLAGYSKANDVQQAVIESMCFQLGSLAEWPQFRAALAAQDWAGAAAAAMDSRWARQTPKRAKRETDMLASGQWIDQDAE